MKRINFEILPLPFILVLHPLLNHSEVYLIGITSEYISIAFSILCGMIVWLRTDYFHFNKLDFIFLLFVIYYAGFTLARGPSFNQWTAIKTAGYILLYFYFRSIRLKKEFFLFLFCAGLIQSIWTILQLRGILSSYHYLLKGTGGFFNPALLGIFLVLSFLAGIALYDKKMLLSIRILLLSGLILLLSIIIISGSRASWIALVIGCMWIFLIEHRHPFLTDLKTKWQNKRLCYRLLLLLSGGITIGLAIYSLYMIRPASVHGRFLIWQVIISKFLTSPWIGHGPLESLYMPAQAEWFQAHPDSDLMQAADNNIYAFNEFLRILFETGLGGLILFIILLITGGYYILKGNRLSHYAGSLLLAILSFGLFNYPFSDYLIITVNIVGLTIVSQHIPSMYKFVCHSYFTRYAILLSGFLFLIFITKEYNQEKKADTLLTEIQHKPAISISDSIGYYQKNLEGNPDFILCYSKTLYHQGFYTKALHNLEKAYLLKPSSELVCDLGKCYQYEKRYGEAEEAYLQASFMTPAHILPQYHLFCLYQATNNLQKARERARYMLNMPVKVVNTSVLRSRNQARIFLENQSFSE